MEEIVVRVRFLAVPMIGILASRRKCFCWNESHFCAQECEARRTVSVAFWVAACLFIVTGFCWGSEQGLMRITIFTVSVIELAIWYQYKIQLVLNLWTNGISYLSSNLYILPVYLLLRQCSVESPKWLQIASLWLARTFCIIISANDHRWIFLSVRNHTKLPIFSTIFTLISFI